MSNTAKMLFPGDGITKGDLIEYYRTAGPYLIPYLRHRPLALERYPDGIDAQQIFHQNVPQHFPSWLETAAVDRVDGSGQVEHAIAHDTASLVYLANQACITPHAWLSRADRVHHPDQLIFDLDPPDGFEAARRAAFDLRALLDDLGLPALVKTTGSKGLHVHVPLDRTADFDTVRTFARDVAGVLVLRYPKRYTIEQRKTARRGRLYLDIMRNAYGQTAVPPYAVRARPGAPIAAPLDWTELDDPGLRADHHTLRTVPQRLEDNDGPWPRLRGRSRTQPRRRLNTISQEH
ncbi:MAG TPA: non-homologous end-joining DNA ligase [Kribbella sp.]|nr:non-homologous end-joining DNA ligase [Kribbella sp.]